MLINNKKIVNFDFFEKDEFADFWKKTNIKEEEEFIEDEEKENKN